MPTHGGTRSGSGRKAGVPNKASAECKACARKYGPAAIKELVKLAGLLPGGKGRAENEQARIAAMAIILDCAYGKPAQPYTGEGEEGPIQIQDLLKAVDGKTRGIPNVAQD